MMPRSNLFKCCKSGCDDSCKGCIHSGPHSDEIRSMYSCGEWEDCLLGSGKTIRVRCLRIKNVNDERRSHDR